jgi:hypothetical protein
MQDNFTNRWNHITATLKGWRKYHRDYAPQIVIWQKRFDKLRIDSEKNLCEYRRTRRPSHNEQAEKLLTQAERELKVLSRLEFLASLSK